MRLLCIVLSLGLHAGLLTVLLFGVELTPQPSVRPLLEMDLVDPVATPQAARTEQPQPPEPPAAEKTPPKSPPEPPDKPPPPEKPDLAPEPPKTSPRSTPPPPPASKDIAAAEPAQNEPEPAPPVSASPPADTAPLPKSATGVVVKNEHGDRLKHGAEARGLQALAAKEYRPKDYAGHYSTIGKRRVSIIDGRETWGRLILYDSQTGLLRTLKPFAKHIYTYGPAFLTDEPIQGSVTFIPSDDDVSRFIWLPEEGPAEFPNRIEPPQTAITVRYGQTEFPAQVFNMAQARQRPLVLVAMRTRNRSLALAHLLASQGLRVCAVDQQSWHHGKELPGTMRQARNLLQTMKTVRQTHPGGNAHICLWTEPSVCPACFRTAALARQVKRVLVQLDPDAPCPHECPTGAGLSAPVAWMLPPAEASSCTARLRPRLEAESERITLLPWGNDASAPRRLDAAITWLTHSDQDSSGAS